SVPEERSLIPTEAEPIDPPFVSTAASFERVSDDEERAMNGEMFKDARLQERIMDAVHAVEFDLEDVPSAPVGALLTGSMTDSGSFERIADDDDSAEVPLARSREMEAAHVRDFVDEIADESSRGFSFQRISDDEESQVEVEEPAKRSAPRAVAKKETSGGRRKKSGVISRFFKSKTSEEHAVETGNEHTSPI